MSEDRNTVKIAWKLPRLERASFPERCAVLGIECTAFIKDRLGETYRGYYFPVLENHPPPPNDTAWEPRYDQINWRSHFGAEKSP